VTFICSKTDDISLSEASDSLGLDNDNGPLWEEMDQHAKKQRQLKKDLEELKETKATYGEAMQDVDDQLETWEGLREKLDNGSTVYPPKTDKKRKAKSSSGSRKKQKRSSDDEAEDDGDYKDEESANEDDEEHEDEETTEDLGSPLTEEQITAKIGELRGTKKEARRQRTELDDKMKAIRSEIAEAQAAEKKIESQISKVCIEGRNAYSKGAIQQDFAGKPSSVNLGIDFFSSQSPSWNEGARSRTCR
jgi:chromosome segregation ATPase